MEIINNGQMMKCAILSQTMNAIMGCTLVLTV